MRTFRRGLVAALTVAAFSSILAIREAPAQETVMVTEDAAPGGDCNCKGVQRPPWHGSVRGPACGPACAPHGGMFHADPRGQLCMKHQARAMGATPPSYFPRLQTWCAEGYMPTPRPLALPHCRHCGMPLEDSGF